VSRSIERLFAESDLLPLTLLFQGAMNRYYERVGLFCLMQSPIILASV